MKILCTGNPTHKTVASAIFRRFPHAEFASRATGYDLSFWQKDSENFFRDNISRYDVFINASYICDRAQLTLLEICHNMWSQQNQTGHIINIGSTAELFGIDSVFGKYSIEKRALRDRSLQLNGVNNIKTSHITAGGLNDGLPGHEKWLDLDILADTINWILHNPARVPCIHLQA